MSRGVYYEVKKIEGAVGILKGKERSGESIELRCTAKGDRGWNETKRERWRS